MVLGLLLGLFDFFLLLLAKQCKSHQHWRFRRRFLVDHVEHGFDLRSNVLANLHPRLMGPHSLQSCRANGGKAFLLTEGQQVTGDLILPGLQ